jgi:sporulation protein YlmC with PRC-barrel domain
MRKITYSAIAVFAFSVLFLAVGTSSSQSWPEGIITMYGQSDITGWNTLEASSMIGSQLLTTEGDYLGVISDLVVDPGSGHVLEAVLSDVPGKGAEFVSVPFEALSRTGENVFVLNIPDDFSLWDQMSGYPEAPFSSWVELRYYYRYYCPVEPRPVGSINVSTLIGAPVDTSKGERVARVNDFVIDFSKNQVVYSILFDVGGMEGKMVAVPFRELSKKGKNAFTLNTTREKLVDSPAFTWSDMGNRKYADNVYRCYGVQPYWEEK